MAVYAAINRVGQKVGDCAGARASAASGPAGLVGPPLAFDAFALKRAQRSKFQVTLEDAPDPRGLVDVHHQPALGDIVAEWRTATHAQALGFGSGDLVADALAGGGAAFPSAGILALTDDPWTYDVTRFELLGVKPNARFSESRRPVQARPFRPFLSMPT